MAFSCTRDGIGPQACAGTGGMQGCSWARSAVSIGCCERVKDWQ